MSDSPVRWNQRVIVTARGSKSLCEMRLREYAAERAGATTFNRSFGTCDFPFGSQMPRLFDGTRAEDEDINQSSGAGLPIGRGGDVGDTDQGAK